MVFDQRENIYKYNDIYSECLNLKFLIFAFHCMYVYIMKENVLKVLYICTLLMHFYNKFKLLSNKRETFET